MKLRVPKLTKYFEGSNEEKDPIQKTVGFMKEFEIVELIMDDSKEFYNQRYSKNTPDIEEKLYSILEDKGQTQINALDTMMKDNDGDLDHQYQVAFAKK